MPTPSRRHFEKIETWPAFHGETGISSSQSVGAATISVEQKVS
jgi:hypothetical protein